VGLTAPPVRVGRAAKSYPCDWCWEPIIQGEPYMRWFCYEEGATGRMRPECFKASGIVVSCGEALPSPGTYRRGCHCGENESACLCGGPGDEA
jgi:hypothetical protein